jgi:hypothetical protein
MRKLAESIRGQGNPIGKVEVDRHNLHKTTK